MLGQKKRGVVRGSGSLVLLKIAHGPWAILGRPGHHPAAVEALKARLCVDTREASRIARAAGDVIGRVDAGQALPLHLFPSISSPPSPTQTFFVSGVAEQNLSEQRGTGGEGGGLSNFGDLPAVSRRGELKQGALRLLRRWALSACSGASHGEARGFLHLGKCGGGNAHQGGLGSGQLAVPHMD